LGVPGYRDTANVNAGKKLIAVFSVGIAMHVNG
jgi:hypothetical protein